MYNNELYNNNMYNGKQLDIKFKGKKELYNFYGVNIFPHSYEIVMSSIYVWIKVSSRGNTLLEKSIDRIKYDTSHQNSESYSVNADESHTIKVK